MTSFAREYGGPVEKLRPGIIARMKIEAPAIFAECHKFAASDDRVVIMTPDETLIAVVYTAVSMMRMERYYRAHFSKHFRKEYFAEIAGDVNPDAQHIVEKMRHNPRLRGTTIVSDIWDDAVEIHAGWFYNYVEFDTNIKRLLQQDRYKKRDGVYVQNGPRRIRRANRNCISVRGLSGELLIDPNAFVAMNNEILRVFDALDVVSAILPQPIAEEIHTFFW